MTKEKVFRSIESHEHEEIIHGRCRKLEPESPPFSGEVIRFPATTSPKTRRSLKKRVVSIPIKSSSDGSRVKGEGSAPPSDSWAWRKYGQKPIKGSPYPRAYYRCSSSKGCPAKKQVERNRDDPTMLLITYSSEHNHLRAAARNINHHNNNHQHSPSQSEASTPATVTSSEPEPESAPTAEIKSETPPLLVPPSLDEFGWFTDMQTTSSMLMDSPFFAESGCNNKRSAARDADVAMFFPVGVEEEEDDSLFADLGELPEFSIVF